jgi:diguanylate cyclase (GGDEF)-like protein/PAS domain S-box-containing protein
MTDHDQPTSGASAPARAMFRAIVDHSSELVVVTDAFGTIRYASPASSIALGYEIGEYDGRSVFELVHPDEIDDAIESLATTATAGGIKAPMVIRLRQRDENYRPFEVIATNLLNDPDVAGIVFHGRDLTDRLEQDRRFRMLFEQSPIPSAFVHLDRGVFANHSLCALLGYTKEELLTIEVASLMHRDDFARGRLEVEKLWGPDHEAVTNEQRWIRKDGSTFWGRTTTRLLFDENEQPEALFAAIVDITAERESRAALADSERRFRAIVDNSTDIIAVLEPDGNWSASDAGTRQLGYPKGFDPDGGVFSLVHPDELGSAAEALAEVLDGRRGPLDTIELRLRDIDGNYHFYECVGQNLGDDADVAGVVITARNVDRRKELEAQLARDATHDALTGLFNRVAFMNAIDRAMARQARSTKPLGLMFLDLDRFKQVNDTLGHAAGDTLLIEVARRIERCVRATDTIARLGGDEFVVLCEDLDSHDRLDEIARRIVDVVEERVLIGDREAFVGASIGIAFAQPGQTAGELMRDADSAVYRAKREGRARVERFDDAMRADTAARVSLEIELRHALEATEIGVEYEPVITLDGAVIEAFVARPTWTSRDGRVTRGSALRVLADEAGLGRLLGQQLLHIATRDLANWRGEQPAGSSIRLFMSPTPRHLVDREFLTDLTAALDAHVVAPGALCIGVPAEWMVDETGTSLAAMTRVRDIGVRLAVNGFGRAHSSLADLRRMPVDIVRLDPKFAFGLAVDPAGAAIVNAVVGLADALDLRVLADGVDEVEFFAALFTLGCDYATGDLLARPVDATTAASLLGHAADFSPI